MQRLDAGDLERIGRFVAAASDVELRDVPFPPELLAALRALVPCDGVTFSELDRVRERVLGNVEEPVWDAPEPEISYWEVRHEHPTCSRHEATGDFRAHRISDFVGHRALRRRRIYSEWFRPQGVEHQLTVGLDAPLWHTKVFLFSRGAGADFTEHDCAVLDVLRPCLQGRYELWASRRGRATGADDDSGLTTRECEVLGLVAEGLTNAQIAERLWISTGTVRRHLENAYGKLGVHTRTAAVRAASLGT